MNSCNEISPGMSVIKSPILGSVLFNVHMIAGGTQNTVVVDDGIRLMQLFVWKYGVSSSFCLRRMS